MNKYLDIYINKASTIYSTGYYIVNVDELDKTVYEKKEYDYARIPIKHMQLPLENTFDNYDEITYIILKFEYLYYNDFIAIYLKRVEKNVNIPNKNLEHNIFRKYMSIKELERKMK